MRIIKTLLGLILIGYSSFDALIAQTGGPYSNDENTFILMHFDNDLTNDGSYTGTVSNWGNNISYEVSKGGLDNCFRLNNSDGLQCLLVDSSPKLDLGTDWTIEFWVKIGNCGSGAAEYPSIFIKDGYGVTAVVIGLRSDGKGFNGEVTFSDDSQVRIEQTNGLNTDLWHHVALVSNSTEKTISLIIHDEDWFTIFNSSESYTGNSDGALAEADRQMFIGGVDGSSNIQFDGWIDEFRISNIARDFSHQLPDLPPLQAQTDNLELYASPENADNLTAISESLQSECTELSSFWDRPLNDSVLAKNSKIKMYLLNRDDFQQYVGRRMPKWKCAWFDNESSTIVLTNPETQIQTDYYGSFEALAKGSIAQLMVFRKLKVRQNREAPNFFLEGFGLYRGGYRPERSKILEAINDLGRYPKRNDIAEISNFNESYFKDLITAYIECQLFNGFAYLEIDFWMESQAWDPYFKYYYEPEENERIMLRDQSENFDFYCAAQDIQYLDQIKSKLEEKLAHYEECYQKELHNRFNIIIFPTAQAGVECMTYDDYNGGSGCGGDKLDILSPVYFGGGIEEALLSLIPHEFFHVFHNHLTPSMSLVYGFHAEGMAEIMAYEGTNDEYLSNYKQYIKNGLERFVNENGRVPKLADIMPDEDFYMSVYTYGQAFWHYMQKNHASYTDIKNFFMSGNDWNVFDITYEEIDKGYISYLQYLAGYHPNAATSPVPANNSQEILFPLMLEWNNGSSTSTIDLLFGTENPPVTKVLTNDPNADSYITDELEYSTTYYWQVISHNDYGDAESDIWNFTTKPQGVAELLSPNGGETFYVGNTVNISWSFDYILQLKIELSVDGGENWTLIEETINASTESYNWIVPDNVSQNCLIKITDKSDEEVFDISDAAFIIDLDTGVDDIVSNVPESYQLMQNYPNPFNPSTTIVYGVPEEAEVSIKVFDILGREVAELVNERKTAGYYNVDFGTSSIGNGIESGVYFYRMQSGDFTSIKKFVLVK